MGRGERMGEQVSGDWRQEEGEREAGRRGEMGDRENSREAQSGKETRKGLGGYS